MCFSVWNKPNRRIVWNHSSPLSRSAVMATAYDWHKTHCSFLSFSPRGRFSVLSERWVKKSRKQGNHRLQGEAGIPEGIYANWFIGVRANCWCTLLTNCPSFIWIKRCWTITKKSPISIHRPYCFIYSAKLSSLHEPIFHCRNFPGTMNLWGDSLRLHGWNWIQIS